MSFVSSISTGRLSEKPWRANAVVRLGASVVTCMLMGGLLGAVADHFNRPRPASGFLFFVVVAGALVCFASALLILRWEWPFETFMLNLVICMVGIYAGFLLMWYVGRLEPQNSIEMQDATVKILLGVGSFQGMTIVLVHFFLREQKLTWLEAFGFRSNTGHALLLGACVGMIALPAVLGMQSISAHLLESVKVEAHEQEAVHLLRNTQGWMNWVVLGIATIVVAPVAEELLFRGILYPWIKRARGQQVALWTTAILFGVIHFNLPTLLPLVFLALVLVWIYEHTGNLLACIATHSLFNAANFVALYLLQT
jgi:membrane protease YdiL (CAAX protease family)